jgi:hypothetical protein
VHVDSMNELAKDGETITSSARKLMHRFKEEQVEKLMDDVDSKTT